MNFHPDSALKCLLVQPRFAAFSFWNYIEGCKHIGAKTPSPPLGLLTVAALLPQTWEYRLLDLNTRDFSQADWDWADLVCVGGMLPQQQGILEVIERGRASGKFIAVGGADPSSQPGLYEHTDALVVGEGESAIPIWLQSWRDGQPRGTFKEGTKPDMTTSPIPRFDLLRFEDYAQIGVQYSRGCPFNCEFCDIIELFGRKPRTKTPEQILAELDRLKALGYSGSVDIVDDNFIGNKRNVKRNLLPALIEWNKKNRHVFYYCTEASMNVADDVALLEQLRDADFRVIFMGIETPDPDLLLMTQKSQNTVKPIAERVNRCYEYGIVVTAGFIMGFDGEKPRMDTAIVDLVEECSINMAMVGLLVALPNTQLTRRLIKENRLLSFQRGRVNASSGGAGNATMDGSAVAIVDQTLAGLNFVTTRDRVEIFEEYMNAVRTLYEPARYFDRALRLAKRLKCKSKHLPRPFELKRNLKAFGRVCLQMTKDPATRWRFWRNVAYLVTRGPVAFEQVMRLHGMYAHFRQQVDNLLRVLEKQLPSQLALGPEVRMVAAKEPEKKAQGQG